MLNYHQSSEMNDASSKIHSMMMRVTSLANQRRRQMTNEGVGGNGRGSFKRSHSVCIAPTKDGNKHKTADFEKVVFSNDGKVKFYDDGQLSIAPLWSYHTFTVLVVLMSVLLFEALYLPNNQ